MQDTHALSLRSAVIEPSRSLGRNSRALLSCALAITIIVYPPALLKYPLYELQKVRLRQQSNRCASPLGVHKSFSHKSF